MAEALIYSACRTAVGRHGGILSGTRSDDLAALVVQKAVERAGVEPESVDDVILGCANQAGEDNRNVARMASLLAGFPVEVPGQTVNRLCGSGLQAVINAGHAVKAGEGDCIVTGGVESMTRAPFVSLKSDRAWPRVPPVMADTTVGWRFINPRMTEEWTVPLGITAENVAERYEIPRKEQEYFACESQRRAFRAIENGAFLDEIIPVDIPQKDGTSKTFAIDEHPRPGIEPKFLNRMKPAFKKDGTITAATASGINDGAAALVVGSDKLKDQHRPLARIVASAVVGVDPAYMGLGPIPATQKVLERAGLSMDEIDLIELNEAFASTTIACIRDLKLDPEKVNIYGGAIALGHPLGCTGAKMLTTLLYALKRTSGRYGLVTMCIGVGQGIALIVERV